MSTLLLASGAAVWWFVGLVATQLLWRELPRGEGTFLYEAKPMAYLVFLIASLTGPVLAYFYVSRATANKIEEGRARKQVRDVMKDEQNKLVLQYHEKLMEQEGLGDIAVFDPAEGEIQ